MCNEIISIIISIHALREEGDYARGREVTKGGVFLSTPSARRATLFIMASLSAMVDFYPRPPRGGRLDLFTDDLAQLGISIHALREEGDFGGIGPHPGEIISIHALREEGDNLDLNPDIEVSKFLSTPSARRATYRYGRDGRLYHDFYPRPPRGGRRYDAASAEHWQRISIHALREEGDIARAQTGVVEEMISIHALREEGDRWMFRPFLKSTIFLSTPSARRATREAAFHFRMF